MHNELDNNQSGFMAYSIYIWILYRKPWTQIRIWIKTLQCALRDHDWNAAKRTSICPQCYNSSMVQFSATTLVWSSPLLHTTLVQSSWVLRLLSYHSATTVVTPSPVILLLSSPVQCFFSCPAQSYPTQCYYCCPVLFNAFGLCYSFEIWYIASQTAIKRAC